jgi:thiol:disulfide interchange protein
MRIAILLSACLLLSGCDDGGTSTVQTPEPTPQKPVEPETEKPATPAATVTATVTTAEEVDQLIASFRGKFVVMDLWAMW